MGLIERGPIERGRMKRGRVVIAPEPGSIDDKSTLDAISREGRGCVAG